MTGRHSSLLQVQIIFNCHYTAKHHLLHTRDTEALYSASSPFLINHVKVFFFFFFWMTSKIQRGWNGCNCFWPRDKVHHLQVVSSLRGWHTGRNNHPNSPTGCFKSPTDLICMSMNCRRKAEHRNGENMQTLNTNKQRRPPWNRCDAVQFHEYTV